MAQAGLEFGNPLDPLVSAPISPAGSGSGSAFLQQSLADIAVIGEQALQQVPMRAPQVAPQSGPSIAFSPSTKQFFVQGRTFSEDDAQSALESEALLGQPGVAAPQGGDWVPVDPQSYAGYLQGIKNPSLTTLAAKGFGRGIDTMQLLAGRGLQLAGAEKFGGDIVQQQMEDLRRTEPYSRRFSDIQGGGDAVEWFVANLAEQSPMLLEGVLTGGLGAIAGSTAARVGAGVALRQTLRKRAEGIALNAAEQKLVRYAAGGAIAASLGSNYATGAADIYGEFRDQGADANDAQARVLSLLGAVPYALFESAPEVALGARVLKGFGAPKALAAGASLKRRGAELLRRGAVGGALGGAAEGATEAGQEALLLGLTGQDFSKPENVTRLIDSFAAGAAIGGPIGAVANLRSKEPADLLNPGAPTPRTPLDQLDIPTVEGEDAQAAAALNALRAEQGLQALDRGDIPAVSPESGVDPWEQAYATPQQMDRRYGPPEMVGPPGPQMSLPLVGGATRTGPVNLIDPRIREQPFGPPSDIQDVLPFESGLAPFRYAPTTVQETLPPSLETNPILQTVRRQAEFAQAQAGRQPVVTPEVSALQQRLAESQPFMQMVETRLPEPQYGVTVEEAAESWRSLQGPGRPKPFERFLPEIQNQWIDALNMAQTRELTRDDLKRIRAELVKAEGAARLGNPVRTVVTGAITDVPTPTPPKGGKLRAKKPEAAKVPTAKQPATRGEALKRPTAKPTVKPTGKPVTEPKKPAESTAKPVQEKQGEAVQALKKGKGEQKFTKAEAAPVAPSVVRGEMPDANRLDDAITFVEEATTKTPNDDVRDAYYDILELAFFERLSSGTVEGRKAIQSKARAFLNQTVSKWHKPILAKAFRAHMRREEKLSAQDPWFQYAVDNDLIESVAPAAGKVTGLEKIDNDLAVELLTPKPKPAVTKQATYETKPVAADTALSKLAAILTSKLKVFNLERPFTFSQTSMSKEEYPNLPFALEDLYADVNEADRDTLINGYPLRDYFTKDGEAKFERDADGMNTPTAKKDNTGRFALVSVKGTKVVGSDGKPLVVYHGTNTLFRTFTGREDKRSAFTRFIGKIIFGLGFGNSQQRGRVAEYGATWFTSDREVAAGYAQRKSLDNIGIVREVYLNFKRPLVFDVATGIVTLPDGTTRDYSGVFGRFMNWSSVNPIMLPMARETKADGVILRGISDGATYETSRKRSDIYIAFSPEQIVPADANVISSFNQPDRADPAVGKLRMAISRFTSKLATKPKVSVFANQADMKAKNPALYRKAVAARPEGDFDTALAAGFSFGDGNVVIFTDRIANEQHLNFVLAHETFGHFGLRGIIPAKQFDAVMEAVYKASPAIRSDVDIAVANGQSKAEAVEEYLSDFAAVLDTSVVARIWNAIKGALNKLGIKFGDEMVRYILKQSRAYARSGKSGMFDAAKVFSNLQDVEYGNGYASTGRFSTVGDIYADMRTAELVRDNIGGMPSDWESAWADIKGVAGNNIDRFDRFKAEFLSLANFRARENPGLNRLEEILEAARNTASSIRVSSNERNAEIFNAAVLGKYFGVTDEQTASVNKLMYAAQRLAVSKIKDIRSLKGAPLYDFKDGVLTPNQPEINKLTKQGMVEFEQARDGFTYEVQLPDGSTREEKFEGIPGLTKESIEWRGYVSLRETVNDVELRLLRARYESLFEDQKIAFKQFDELVENKRLTNAERELLRRIIKTFNDLYTADITFDERGYPKLNTDAMTRGNDFVVAINKALTLGQERDFDAVASFFEGKAADDMVAQMREFRKRLKLGAENKYTIQNRVKQIGLLEVSNTDADLYTRRTLATGYSPLLREGQFQIRVEAVSPTTGKVVRLADAYREQLIYSQVEKQSEAEELAAGINDVFKGKTYEVDAYSSESGEFVRQTVEFRAVSETALDAIAGPPELNLNEFVYGLRQLDIALTPKEVERVVTALTKQNSAARNRLMRAFTPGADPDAIKAVAQHVDSRASTIAKTIMRPQLGELMNLSMESTQRLWNGDPKLLADLKAMAENTNLSQGERRLAQKEYDRYRYMYEQTNPKGKPKRTNQFYNEASRTAAFLDDNRSVTESNFESGAIASRVRALTSIMQLGGSIATGALNLISAYTNGLPFLASYNSKNGFGGGFGIGPSVAQFHIAAKQVGALGMTNMRANTAEFYDEVAASDDLQIRYNLKKHEAEFIAREIREGAMIPAQTNALINTARGKISSGFRRKFVDGWMLPFNLTEQASRRTLGLAAYRLEYESQIAGGKSETEAQEAARRFAVEALNLTMGEYSVLNRPPAWRSGIQSFLYMYKVFPTTSIQLFSNLSRGGKIAMLASLWLLSGLQGLPFAEDLEDLIDTLAQALGFKTGSIRMEIAKFIDGVFPGMSPYFLQGVVNSAVPADIGGRVSVGNVLPGTGILLSGADVGRELTDIAGPAPSALLGSAKFFADLMRVPFSDRIQLTDVAREAPVTMLRAAGDAVAYAKSDAIVDRRGYVVADDANAGVIAARLLGFYPAAAAQEYSTIRVANRVSDYQRDVVAGFRTAWIKAKMEGDDARARDIVTAVNDWNKGAEGTGLKIDNFLKNSQRALKEAQRPAGERTLRTTPKAGREDIEKAFELLTY